MKDLVELLRQAYHNDLTDAPLLIDAADAIDKLVAENAMLKTSRDLHVKSAASHFTKCCKLETRTEELEKVLELFADAAETTNKIHDINGINEFLLSFGPVPVSVIPLTAFVRARAVLTKTRNELVSSQDG